VSGIAKQKISYSAVLILWTMIALYFGVGAYSWVKPLTHKVAADSAFSTVAANSTGVASTNVVPGPTATNTQAVAAVKTNAPIVYSYKGILFVSRERLDEFRKDEPWAHYFSWALDLPEAILQLIVTFAFGSAGASIGQFREVLRNSKLNPVGLLEPMFGGFVGLLILFLSFAIPSVLTTGDFSLRPETLAGLCLLTGLRSERAFNWVVSKAVKLLD